MCHPRVLVLTSHFGESLIWGLAAGLNSSLIEEPLEASEADGSFSAQLTAGHRLKAQNRRWCLKVVERAFCAAGGQRQVCCPDMQLLVFLRSWKRGEVRCVTCICTCMLRVRLLSLHLSAERPGCPRSHWLAFQKSCPRQDASAGSCQSVGKERRKMRDG